MSDIITFQPTLIPNVIKRPEHTISRQNVSKDALKVLYTLKDNGYEAYLVGGCVRDMLLGREPKDFDVVTNAKPEELVKIFRTCRLVGRRFRLAHIHFGRNFIEVATFRRSGEEGEANQILNKAGRLVEDNIYGTIDDDVSRRDFTVNALYYNIRDFSIVDYVNGINDLEAGLIRLIGEPEKRFREDPVRMIRAVRFAVKLGFQIHQDCLEPIANLAYLLGTIPAPRLYDEVIKLFLSGYGVQTFEMLRHYGLFKPLFPMTEKSLSNQTQHFPKMLIIKALESSDERIQENKPITSYFLFAAFLYEPMKHRARQKIAQGMSENEACRNASFEVLLQQNKSTALPKFLMTAIQEVWFLQSKFANRLGAKPSRFMTHPRFRAAYDFLALRVKCGDGDSELVDWWERYQIASEEEKIEMTTPQKKPRVKTKTKRKPFFRRRKSKTALSQETT